MILEKNRKLKFYIKRAIEQVSNYQIRYHLPPWERENFLFTFDDGPLPSTLDILDILSEYKIRALFFMIASQVLEYPQIARKIAEKGHLIGSHGLFHLNMKNLSLGEFSAQVERSFEIIRKTTGLRTYYFRPPFGQIGLIQTFWLLKKGMNLFFWSVGVSKKGDFDFINPRTNGGKFAFEKEKHIILLHDHTPLKVVNSTIKFFKQKANNF